MADIAIKEPLFQQGCSFGIIWAILLYTILNQWFDFRNIAKKYVHYSHSWLHHVIFYMGIVFKIYMFVFLWLVIVLVILIVIYFLILKILSFDSNIFKKVIRGDIGALLEASEKGKGIQGSTTQVQDISNLIFAYGIVSNGFHVLLNHIVMSVLFVFIFSYFVSPPKTMTKPMYQENNVRLFFIMYFTATMFHFIFNLVQP